MMRLKRSKEVTSCKSLLLGRSSVFPGGGWVFLSATFCFMKNGFSISFCYLRSTCIVCKSGC